MNRTKDITTEIGLWEGLTCTGNLRLLQQKKNLILNSHQGKQPTGDLPWVRKTLEAVRTLSNQNEVFLTSTGLNTWELVCWAAGAVGVPQIIGVPEEEGRSPSETYRDLIQDFELDPEKVCLVLFPVKKRKPKSYWQTRDEVFVDAADELVPVSVKTGGRMEALLAKVSSERIRGKSQVPWQAPPGRGRRLQFDTEAIRRDIDPHYEGWLIHWVRACDGPWPGESRAEYYRAIAESSSEYPRSAKRTLERISREGVLRGSAWRMRGGLPTVCFSALPPSQAASLMRWRTRYNRYTIEPYGIAIHPEAAVSMGIRPVTYVQGGPLPPDVPDYLIQGAGKEAYWPREEEHRYPGNLDLSRIAKEEWSAIDISVFLSETP